VKNHPSNKPRSKLLRTIPSLDELLLKPEFLELAQRIRRSILVEITRHTLAEIRDELTRKRNPTQKNNPGPTTELLEARIIREVQSEVERALAPSLRPVINATGVVLHTNLGRAPLSHTAFENIRAAATQYSNVEYDLASGKRGTRDSHTSALLARLCGAESAIVVNNNAAAVYLVLAALARGGEAIVSRGELIEIGDGFRIPDIMSESGAVLREVGTTNRTRLADYERAVNKSTRLILRVHRSNFRLVGFASQPALAELSKLARSKKIPLYEDLGSGCLTDLRAHGIDEPVVRESFAAGANIVSFSGDKLLAGPQAGIIAGKKDLIARIRKHPMFRALRVDKLTIAALESTLRAYIQAPGSEENQSIPILKMISATAAEISARNTRFLQLLQSKIPADRAQIEIKKTESVIGGGSTPGQVLSTTAIAVSAKNISPSKLEERLRNPRTGIPVITRVEKNQLWIDLRTVFADQESALAKSLVQALS
jgi:L-seryl-tRNA(Ser) seleniumtransferase